MLLGYKKIIPAMIGEVNYDFEATIRGKYILFKGNLILKTF
jgi:hypothetical protein